MSFETNLAAAKASGEPFAVLHDVTTGEDSVQRYDAAELAAITAKAARANDQRIAEQTITDARSARLRTATTVDDLRQFIEDELVG